MSDRSARYQYCEYWHIAADQFVTCGEHVMDTRVLLCKKHLRYVARVAGYVPRHEVEQQARRMAEADIFELERKIRWRQETIDHLKAEAKRKRSPQPTDGHIYFLLSDSIVKIGWTSDLERRLKEYSPGARVLAVMPGTRKDETRLHRKFAHLRTNRSEWFAYSPQVMEEVERIVKEHGGPPRELNEPVTTKRIVGPRLNGPMRIKDYRG